MKQLIPVLGTLLGQPVSEAQPDCFAEADAVLSAGKWTFVVRYSHSGSAASVARAIELLDNVRTNEATGVVFMIVVPYMGEVGKRRCEHARLCWMDLCGNADITGEELRIYVDGRLNAYKRPGRPSNAFASKSSRIARRLLLSPASSFTLKQLAEEAGVGRSLACQVVKRLEELFLLTYQNGDISVPDPTLLLDAWWERYDFSKHDVIKGHVRARSGTELLHGLSERLEALGLDYAATGLSGAWLLTEFAFFGVTTFYLDEYPSPEALKELGFETGAGGANTWLVVPDDQGVFHGAAEVKGVRCAHPLQVYLDLKGHPERAKEAAERLRSDIVRWSDYA